MKTETNIRPASEEDFDDIFSIMTDMLQTHMSLERIAQLRPSYHKRFLEIIKQDSPCFFVAMQESTIVGFLNGSPSPALWNIPEDKTLFIEEMAVHEQFRSTGIGAALLAFLETYAKKNAYKKIAASSHVSRERAHQFYRNNGFEKDESRFSKHV